MNVVVVDQYGRPVAGADVTAHWRGSISDYEEQPVRTNVNGSANIRSPPGYVRAPFGAEGVITARKGFNYASGNTKSNAFGDVQPLRLVMRVDVVENVGSIVSKGGKALLTGSLIILGTIVGIVGLLLTLRR